MPPIFGIIQTNLHQPDPELIGRLKRSAVYVLPRRIEGLEILRGYLGTAVSENPLKSSDAIYTKGDWTIITDAALYKRESLISDLEIKDTEISDPALILESWIRKGKDCMKSLYGDFAFVIANQLTGEIFCGRDHLGVRPLFYAYFNGSFVFGSELRYVGSAVKNAKLRTDYLTDTLITVKSKKDETPFENVFRLKPAHFLNIKNDKLVTESYWTVDPGKRISLQNESDYIDLLREKLANSVNIRCDPTAAIGSELSGGLDSSAVTGIANHFLKSNQKQVSAYSNLFPEDGSVDFKDEREFIKLMTDFTGIPWQGIDHHEESIPDILKHSLRVHSCFIQQNFNIFNKSLYMRAGEQGIQILLSGFGGDELVSAKTAVPWNEYIRNREWNVIIDELSYNGLSFKSVLKPFKVLLFFIKNRLSSETHTSGVFTPDLLDKRFANLPVDPDFAGKHNLRRRLGENYRKFKRDSLSERQSDRIMMDHLPQRMEYCYAAAAQYGIEYRYPLLDVGVIETALAFPPGLKQHHGINRYMFRQAIKGFVPEEIRTRNDKTGSTIPQTLQSLISDREEILELIDDASRSDFLNEIFDFPKFPPWYERLVKRDPGDMNYLSPGAFYDYLMILLYFKDSSSSMSQWSSQNTEQGTPNNE